MNNPKIPFNADPRGMINFAVPGRRLPGWRRQPGRTKDYLWNVISLTSRRNEAALIFGAG